MLLHQSKHSIRVVGIGAHGDGESPTLDVAKGRGLGSGADLLLRKDFAFSARVRAVAGHDLYMYIGPSPISRAGGSP